ncbi:YceK/YidQ family lipoprotein [Leptospira gomenensis]|uniref:YceK/YidQ family lipoprotein n=2 Tax=Leptospira gomenensis TaxID=2484974 RepID=UPI003CCC72FE
MKVNVTAIIWIFLSFFFFQSCATTWGLFNSSRTTYYCPKSYDTSIAPSERFSPMYVGVKIIFDSIWNRKYSEILLVDLPLSFALDTLLLPITVLYYWMDIDGSIDKRRERLWNEYRLSTTSQGCQKPF